jgi:hypothetical protein
MVYRFLPSKIACRGRCSSLTKCASPIIVRLRCCRMHCTINSLTTWLLRDLVCRPLDLQTREHPNAAIKTSPTTPSRRRLKKSPCPSSTRLYRHSPMGAADFVRRGCAATAIRSPIWARSRTPSCRRPSSRSTSSRRRPADGHQLCSGPYFPASRPCVELSADPS